MIDDQVFLVINSGILKVDLVAATRLPNLYYDMECFEPVPLCACFTRFRLGLNQLFTLRHIHANNSS